MACPWSFSAAANPLLFSENFAAHILRIPRFAKDVGYLQSALDVWLYFLNEWRDAGDLSAAAAAATAGEP